MDVAASWRTFTGPRLVVYHEDDEILPYVGVSLAEALDPLVDPASAVGRHGEVSCFQTLLALPGRIVHAVSSTLCDKGASSMYFSATYN